MPTGYFVVCKRAADPLVAGYQTGYRCRFCEKDLQASPDAVRHIASGAFPTCNDCGYILIALARGLKKLGWLDVTNPSVRAELVEYLRRGGL